MKQTTPDNAPQISLQLRDIHLPEPVSWWPIAPGWWLALAAILLSIALLILAKKIYRSRQLKRDIHAELENIKQTFNKTGNNLQLARTLSTLLRRASISYYPVQNSELQSNQAARHKANNIAGLTGKDWLIWLDNSNKKTPQKYKFQSELGEILLNAPYLPEDSDFSFDAQSLIHLCESWLLSSHKAKSKNTSKGGI